MARGRQRFRTGFRTVGGKKRKHVWAKDGTTQTIAAAGVSHRNALSVFEGIYGADILGSTVSISHLDIIASPGAITGNSIFSFGARIFTESTLVDLNASHGSGTDPNADWMTYFPILACPDSICTHHKVEFDSQRRLDELGQGLLVSVENASTAPVDVIYLLSISVLLP